MERRGEAVETTLVKPPLRFSHSSGLPIPTIGPVPRPNVAWWSAASPARSILIDKPIWKSDKSRYAAELPTLE